MNQFKEKTLIDALEAEELPREVISFDLQKMAVSVR